MPRSGLRSPPRLTPFAVSYTVIVFTLVGIFYLGIVALTGVRGFVGGESSWSKAQKQAAACLQRYAVERNEAEYACYTEHNHVMLSARRAREELEKRSPNLDTAYKYLVLAKADRRDAPEMAAVFRWLGHHPLMRPVIDAWTEGDAQVAHLEDVAQQMRVLVAAGRTHDDPRVGALLHDVRVTDTRLTQLEEQFSGSLGIGARYISSMLLIVIAFTAIILLGIALLFAARWISLWRSAHALASARAARMRAVASAAAGVGAATSFEELDKVMRAAIATVVDHHTCTFATYDEASKSFDFLGDETDGMVVPPVRVPAVGTPSERFLHDRSSILTLTSNDPASIGAQSHGAERRSESVIRCAMYSGTRLLGMIGVHSYVPNHYTPDDVEVMETLASVASSAVERIESTRDRETAEEGLRRSEEQLAQAQKMEAVGLLAGGIAHDFNNLLTAIKGNAELLGQDDALDANLHEHVSEIAAAADRAAALTGQLLAFSRRQVLQPRVVDLNALVNAMTSLIRRLIGEDVELLASLEPSLWHVRADPHQLEQVLLNLTLNARDAMVHGGALVIETSNVEINGDAVETHDVPTGSYVRLAVNDSGVGMSDDARARIFEPFYTTKPVGKGTGLGLSTVYGIVKQSGGHIAVRSEPNHGTSMEIFLPHCLDPLDPPLEAVAPQQLRVPQSGTVLIVEDETTVRTLLSRVLSREGYNVIEAASGEEALAILNADLCIDLLLTDTVMPGISGVVLAERARIIRPGMAVLHMSGYTEDEVFRRGLSRRGEAFLQKPFSPSVLLRGVAESLAKSS